MAGVKGPIDYDKLRESFSNLVVRKEIATTEGKNRTTFILADKGQDKLIVSLDEDAELFGIVVLSKTVSLPFDFGIGTPYSELTQSTNLECTLGAEENVGWLLCAARRLPNFSFWFDLQRARWNGPKDAVPPASVLSNLRVKKVSWHSR